MVLYLSENLWLLWTIIALVCLIIEIGSGDFYVTCFAIGALGAMVSSFLVWPMWLQILIFAFCSVLSILFIRPPLLKALHANGESRRSNAEALIGRIGIVEERIEVDGSGYVKIDGDVWRAITTDCNAIEQGEKVRVTHMESIIVTVERCL